MEKVWGTDRQTDRQTLLFTGKLHFQKYNNKNLKSFKTFFNDASMYFRSTCNVFPQRIWIKAGLPMHHEGVLCLRFMFI